MKYIIQIVFFLISICFFVGHAEAEGLEPIRIVVIDEGFEYFERIYVPENFYIYTSYLTEFDRGYHGRKVIQAIAKGYSQVMEDATPIEIYAFEKRPKGVEHRLEYWKQMIELDPDIVVMSFAADLRFTAEEAFLKELWKEGVLLLGAAGNNGIFERIYPAGFSEVIAVGSVHDGERTYTNRGFVDIYIEDWYGFRGTSYGNGYMAGVIADFLHRTEKQRDIDDLFTFAVNDKNGWDGGIFQPEKYTTFMNNFLPEDVEENLSENVQTDKYTEKIKINLGNFSVKCQLWGAVGLVFSSKSEYLEFRKFCKGLQ